MTLAREPQGVVKARLDGSQGHSEGGGDFLEVELIGETQREDLSVKRAETLEPGADVVASFERRGWRGRDVVIVRERQRRAIAPATMVAREVARHGIQQRRQPVPELEAGRLADQPRKRLLQHVERLVAAAAIASRHPQDEVAVSSIQLVEALGVAARKPAHELGVSCSVVDHGQGCYRISP